jgi:helix-turn-helix protein
VNDDLLRQLVDSLVDEVAEKVARRLAGLAHARADGAADGDGWHLLDVDEVATRLGRSPRWVRDRARRGDLPHVRLDGGALAFLLADVVGFAEARRIACSPLAPVSDPLSSSGVDGARLRGSQKADRVRGHT